MKTVTATELRSNIYKLLEEVLRTGVPLEISLKGKKFELSPKEPIDKFANLVSHPDDFVGDLDDIVHIEWEYNIDLP